MRVATFNILHGGSPADDRVDVERFAAAVRTLDADVLGLQEVDRDQPRSQMADLTAVAAHAMGAPYHRFVASLAGTPGLTWQAATGQEQPGTAAYGIALLSRVPVRDWQVLRLPALRFPVPMRHGVGRPKLVRDEARVAVMATLQTARGDLLVATTHLSFLPGWNVLQLSRVVRAMSSQPVPAILMGDLNMEPRLAKRVTGMVPLATAPTFPLVHPTRQLDHVLGRDMRVANGCTGRAVALPLSDHRALSTEVAVGHH